MATNPLQQLLNVLSTPAVSPASGASAGGSQAAVAVPTPSSQVAPQTVSLDALIQSMIDANLRLIERFIVFLEKLESDLIAAGAGALNGEMEELLRLLIQTATKSIESLIALHEQLQTELVESFFPAQD